MIDEPAEALDASWGLHEPQAESSGSETDPLLCMALATSPCCRYGTIPAYSLGVRHHDSTSQTGYFSATN